MEGVLERSLNGADIRTKRFVTGLLANGGNQADAYRKAGYKASTPQAQYTNASRKLRTAEVQAVLRQISSMNELKQEEIANGLLLEAHTAPHSRDRISAWSWLGKAKSMFTERVQHDLAGGVVFAWKGEVGLQKPVEGEVLYNSSCTQLPAQTETSPLTEAKPLEKVGGVPVEKGQGSTEANAKQGGLRDAKKG